jgi:hypothetical protein
MAVEELTVIAFAAKAVIRKGGSALASQTTRTAQHLSLSYARSLGILIFCKISRTVLRPKDHRYKGHATLQQARRSSPQASVRHLRRPNVGSRFWAIKRRTLMRGRLQHS